MSKPAVNTLPLLFANVSGFTGVDQNLIERKINPPPPALLPYFLCFPLSCQATHHHIQSVTFQTAKPSVGKLLYVCQALWGGQDVPLMVSCFLWTPALMMPSSTQTWLEAEWFSYVPASE